MRMNPRLLLFGLMSLALVGQAQPWRLESSSELSPMGHGAFFVVKKFTGPGKLEMKLVIFDDRHCQFRVVANADAKTARSLKEIGQVQKALAVCNGGYFHVGGNFGPSGLEIADGKRTDVFSVGDLIGALMVRQGKASLVWGNEFRDSADITQFLQCSPWLVSEGKVVPLPPGEDPRNHRTFILTDGEGRWAIGICNGVGLLELARLLNTPGILPEIKVRRVLNLDGGPSTGLWCRGAKDVAFYEKPVWPVRNMIVVEPRTLP